MRPASLAIFVAIYLMASAATATHAADAQVSASASRQVVTIGETVSYEITIAIDGPGALTMQPEPTLPALPGFAIVGTRTRQDLRMGTGGPRVTRTDTNSLGATAAQIRATAKCFAAAG